MPFPALVYEQDEMYLFPIKTGKTTHKCTCSDSAKTTEGKGQAGKQEKGKEEKNSLKLKIFLLVKTLLVASEVYWSCFRRKISVSGIYYKDVSQLTGP